jgi:hypothetical protein
MSTKQLLAEIERGIKALEKARALCLKSEAVAPKAKAIAAKTAKITKAPAKKAKGGMSDEGRAKIAAAQQKRWAKVRREKKKAAKAALSARAVK